MFDSQDKQALTRLLGSLASGALVNFMLLSVFGLQFSWYSWIGYGIMIHMVEIRLIKWIRLIRFK